MRADTVRHVTAVERASQRTQERSLQPARTTIMAHALPEVHFLSVSYVLALVVVSVGVVLPLAYMVAKSKKTNLFGARRD